MPPRSDPIFDAHVGSLRNQELGAELLVGGLNVAGDVHSVSNGGDCPLVFRRTQGADNGLAMVNTDPHPEALAIELLEIRLELLHGLKHVQPGLYGKERGLFGALQAEQRHQPVAHRARDTALLAPNGELHLVVIAVQHVDHVIRQQVLGEGGEAANVGEEDGELALLTHGTPGGLMAHLVCELGVDRVEHQSSQFHVAGDGRLARKADLRGEVQAFGDCPFFRGAGRAAVQAL